MNTSRTVATRGFIRASAVPCLIASIPSDMSDYVQFGVYELDSRPDRRPDRQPDRQPDCCEVQVMFPKDTAGRCRLEIWSDYWDIFSHCPDLLQILAQRTAKGLCEKTVEISPSEFCEILRGCGFRDRSDRLT